MKTWMISLAVMALPATGWADAIYGCWSNGAERLVVEHARVVTPGGASPKARIDRHNAVYIAPAGERDGGRVLAFRQLNDNQVARFVLDDTGTASGTQEIWGPCEQVNS